MLIKGVSPEALAEHLSSIITESMGMSSTNEQQMLTAQKLLDWYHRRRDGGAK